MKDYYQILEITPDASPDAVKEQYRFLVQAWHPDKFPNPAQKLKAEEKLKEINEAYEILRNSAKRADYDNRIRYTRSNHQQEYRERTAPREPDDERRKKEEAARRAKEEQLQRERANRERVEAEKRRAVEEQLQRERKNRERVEAEKRRAEDLKRQKIFQIDNEISLLNKEISNISQDSPNLPSRKIDLFLFIGGMMFLMFGVDPINYIVLFVGGISFIIGASFMYIRVKPNKSVLSQIEKYESRIAQLIREKRNLT